jgi:hypothetical protein
MWQLLTLSTEPPGSFGGDSREKEKDHMVPAEIALLTDIIYYIILYCVNPLLLVLIHDPPITPQLVNTVIYFYYSVQ